MMRWNRTVSLMLVLVLVSACGNRNRTAERLAEDSAAVQDIEDTLTLSNITLEQSDEQGRVLWEVKAEEATYSPDKATAAVRNPDGQLYQDGKAIYRVQADRGIVQENGEQIELTGNIVATDLRSGAVLKGNKLEWQPKQDLLIVRENITGTHPQLQATASEARISNRQRQMVLSGKVIAVTRDPALRLDAERLTWQMDRQMVLSDRPVQVQRLNGQQVTGQARGDKAEVNLAANTVNLSQNGQLTLQDPPIQVASNALLWNLKEETVTTTQPVRVEHRQQQITLTGDRGRMDLQRQILNVVQNARAVGQQNRSVLTTDNFTWNIRSEEVVAEGNVVYTQADPPLNLTGTRAVGRLRNQTIVVSGGSGTRVETQIIPGQPN